MKLFRRLFVTIILFTAFSTIQAQKVAHIDSEQLLFSMPETKAMQTELKKVEQTYGDEYGELAKSIEAKVKKYTAEGPTQTDAKNQERQLELKTLEQKMQKFGQTAQAEIQKKQFDLLKPIVEKAQKAVKEVAAEKGFIYVFDSSQGKGLIVFDKGEDLLPAVKVKLGIQ